MTHAEPQQLARPSVHLSIETLLDLHVADFDAVLAKLQAEGGTVENEFRSQGPKPVAFCSDPFGNGFCVIGEAPR